MTVAKPLAHYGANKVAAKVNAVGHFDAVIQNMALGYREGHHV
jgi:hypothetical protein